MPSPTRQSHPGRSEIRGSTGLASLLVTSIWAVAATGCNEADSCDGEICCNDAQRLADGTCCIGWTRPSEQGCAARTWELPAPGESWGEPGARRLSVAVTVDGALATWLISRPDTGVSELVLSENTTEDPGLRWTLYDPSAALAGTSLAPSLATGPDARAVLTWTQDMQDQHTVYASTRDDEGRWQIPSALSFPPHASDPHAAISDYAEAVVVWNQESEQGIGVAIASRSLQGPEADFARPRDASDVLSEPSNVSHAPQVAVAGNGDAIVVWYQRASESAAMVFASERNGPEEVFSRPDQLISAPGAPVASDPIRNPVVSMSDHGEALVVWRQSDGAGHTPLFMARRDGFGTWSAPTSLQDTFSAPDGNATDAQIARAADGRVFVLWSHESGQARDVFVAIREPDGVWSVPGTEPTRLSSPQAQAFEPRIATGPHGEAVTVWTEQVRDGPRRVVARRLSPRDLQWAKLETLSSAEAEAGLPAVSVGPQGRTIAGWVEPFPGGRVRFAVIE